jgi:hypothetical protein
MLLVFARGKFPLPAAKRGERVRERGILIVLLIK